MKEGFSILLLIFLATLRLEAGIPQLLKVCYFPNWSQYRSGAGKFGVSEIDLSKCTHLLYAFAKVQDHTLQPVEWNDESTDSSKGNYEKFTDLKMVKPTLKTLLSVGGENADAWQARTTFSDVKTRAQFVDSVIRMLTKWNFDGLDISFGYLGNDVGYTNDKEDFSSLLKDLRYAFDNTNQDRSKFILTVAVPALKKQIDNGYDVSVLNDTNVRNVDYVSLNAYNYHGDWESTTNFHSPLFSEDQLSLNWSASYWVSNGLKRNKLLIGLAMFGRCFLLEDASNSVVGAPASGKCPAGEYTKQAGIYSYYEICGLLKSDRIKAVTFSTLHQSAYMVSDKLWVSFDNVRSLISKYEYVLDRGHAGWVAFDLSMDDFSGQFCGLKNLLLKSLK